MVVKMEAGRYVDVFVFVAREEVLDWGGSQFVYDGEGASGYAPYGGGGSREGSQILTWAAHVE